MVSLPLRAAVVGVAVLTAGCDVDFVSESGRIGFDAPELRRAAFDDFESGDPIVVGSRLCPFFDGWIDDDGDYRESPDEDDSALRACFATSVEGPATEADECLSINAPGEIVWSLQPVGETCLDGEASFQSDRVRLRGVDPDDVVTEEGAVVERWAESSGVAIAGTQVPAGWIPGPGAPLPFVEETVVTAWLGLRDPVANVSVAWTDGLPVVEPAAAEVKTYGDEDDPATTLLRLAPGATAEITIVVADTPTQPLRVEAVPIGELQDLEVVAIADAGDPEVPVLLRAIARDAGGRVVRGVPVQWAVLDGDVELAPLWGEGRDPDYVLPTLPCREGAEEPEIDEATIEARLGTEVVEVALSWTRPACAADDGGSFPGGKPAGGEDDGGEGRDDNEGFGCACASDPGAPMPPLSLALLGAMAASVRRRRRRA